MKRQLSRAAQVLGLALAVAFALGPVQPAAAQDAPPFAIANQRFRDYYQARGGVRTFGYPISRQFTLQGFQVQMFQRGVLQLMPNGGVATMNLLDEGLMPFTSFNFSVVPGPQRELTDAAPSPSDPDYGRKAIEFVLANAPDRWEDLPVNFGRTFLSTVTLETAFPNGNGDPALLPLLNLELWGFPTSRPARDPHNGDFVYQRFQRGIMHYDATSGATQGLLLGDYLKAIMTGKNLPADLEAQARSSSGRQDAGAPRSMFYRQYDADTHSGPLRPALLAASQLGGAFRPGFGDDRFGVVVSGPRSDDKDYVASALSALGAGSWYSFSGNSPNLPGRVELVRPGADLAALATRAKSTPGTAWMIGNEPNVPGQDDLKPAAYSNFLSQVARAIKGADPSATLVGPNVLNWEKTCTDCPGYTLARDWSAAFLADYRERFGPLPLDVWGMHTYSLDWDHLPLADAATDQAQMVAARAWLDGDGLRLPMWLTEFGVIWGFDGIDWQKQGDRWTARPSGSFRSDLVGSYLDSMLGWLTDKGATARVERWFLYATASAPEPYASAAAGISLLDPGRLVLTPFGQRYRAWATGQQR